MRDSASRQVFARGGSATTEPVVWGHIRGHMSTTAMADEMTQTDRAAPERVAVGMPRQLKSYSESGLDLRCVTGAEGVSRARRGSARQQQHTSEGEEHAHSTTARASKGGRHPGIHPGRHATMHAMARPVPRTRRRRARRPTARRRTARKTRAQRARRARRRRAGAITAISAFPVLVIALIVASALGAFSGAHSLSPLSSPPAVADYDQEQLENAASIMRAGHDLGLSARDQAIGVMTALGESSLRNIDYGDWETSGVTNPDGSRTTSIEG